VLGIRRVENGDGPSVALGVLKTVDWFEPSAAGKRRLINEICVVEATDYEFIVGLGYKTCVSIKKLRRCASDF
jgi:hypothetical protein